MVDPLDNLASSEQLRRLLLQEEQDRLDRLEARVGDDGALKNSLVPVIADTLQEAGVKDHRRLAGAIAPIVVQSIKTEIHNSRDMMVDALYPITGRLVAAAVRNAFKDLVEQLNSKLDSSLSVDRWRAKLKSKVTGRSEAEILLSEGAAFEVIELLLINRQSGLLVARAGPDDGEGDVEGHLLSSILTAIMAFVRDAMRDASEQDLRTLHVGDLRLHLQVSPGAILAVKTKGPPPAGFETALNEMFYAFLSRWGDQLSDPDQIESDDEARLNEDLESRFKSLLDAKRENFKTSTGKGTILLSVLGLLIAGWIGWTLYARWYGDHIESEARSVILGQPSLVGYPVDMRYDWSEDVLSISGLVPDQEHLERLRSSLQEALPEIGLSMQVGTLPNQDVDLTGLSTNEDLERWRTSILGELKRTVGEEISSLSEAISRIEGRVPTSLQREESVFRQWLNRQALTFGDDSELDDENEANTILRNIANRLSGLPTGVGIRIVGYGDDLGEERVSLRISRERADLVAGRLRDLGISADRLRVVGRGTEKRVDDVDGPGSANRRVEFELTYLPDDKHQSGGEGDLTNGVR